MIVESIAQFGAKNARSEVKFEDGSSFVLYNKELTKYGISENKDIDSDTLAEITGVLYSRALKRSGELLKSQDYTEKKLSDKLRTGGYPEDVTAHVIKSLREAHYVDDSLYAQHYIKYHIRDKSSKRIRNDLISRGVTEDVIDEAYQSVINDEEDSELLRDSECEQIRALLRKRRFDPETADWNEKQKTMAFLYRKGYEGENINLMMKQVEV
ncbi:MAG: regulatory protein RecX [Clostridiales bacterium]|nr:regulatory protein RecX [Clostridiales bacterium]